MNPVISNYYDIDLLICQGCVGSSGTRKAESTTRSVKVLGNLFLICFFTGDVAVKKFF